MDVLKRIYAVVILYGCLFCWGDMTKLQFIIFIVFFLSFTGNGYSQLQFSSSYEFSGDIKADIENDTTDYGIKVQIGAANYSNSGYFREAQELFGSRPLSEKSLDHFDFIDLNGKDIAEDRERTEKLTYEFARRTGKPVVAGSDTHQALQYGCIKTVFEKNFSTFSAMKEEIQKGAYSIQVHSEASFKVAAAGLLKRSLKEIDALGGDYIAVLLNRNGGESPAVLAAKSRIA